MFGDNICADDDSINMQVYRTQTRNKPLRCSVYFPDILRFQVTDLSRLDLWPNLPTVNT